MKVQDVMNKDVVTVFSDSRLRDLWKLLFSKHVNAIPVIDKEKKLIGLITKEDLLKILYPDYEEYFIDLTGVADFEELENKVRDIGNKKASDIMCKLVIHTREDTPLMRALSRMIVRDVSQLPVLSQNDKIVGMLTKNDIFGALFRKSQKVKAAKKLSA